MIIFISVLSLHMAVKVKLSTPNTVFSKISLCFKQFFYMNSREMFEDALEVHFKFITMIL